MSTDVVDGIEYFNTVVVQPHRKLVTNQGRGYHVRCRYQTQEKTLTNDFNVRYNRKILMAHVSFWYYVLLSLSQVNIFPYAHKSRLRIVINAREQRGIL